VEGKHLLFVKGAFIETFTGIDEKDWIDTVSHYDFDPKAQVEGEAEPITFLISLKGETPLDFGSPARHPTQASDKKVTEERVLKSGDGVAFSWRQESCCLVVKVMWTKMMRYISMLIPST
jgi:hypothetical protein